MPKHGAVNMKNKYSNFPNIAIILYQGLSFSGGVVLITIDSALCNAAGIGLLCHSLVICAYLQHECFHGALFNARHANFAACHILSWLNGSCFADLKELRRMHLNHHVYSADTMQFNYKDVLIRHPLLCRIVHALEWAYIPGVELMNHYFVIMSPFLLQRHRHRQGRTLTILIARISLFLILFYTHTMAVVWYFIAYMLHLSVLRLFDAFQHSFESVILPTGTATHGLTRKDKIYEFENTYSNLISTKYSFLNLLVLNFCYHEAHHEHPTTPWHQLRALHNKLRREKPVKIITIGTLLANVHRFRVSRVLMENTQQIKNITDKEKIAAFTGVIGVSFLTDI